jgi:hypothetical protein
LEAVDTTWIRSLGRPLIVIPESACHHWGGAPPSYPDEEGDYGRACAVDDYIGLIDVGPAIALVLGDMPARTTFLPEAKLFLREIAGSDDFDAAAAVTDLLPSLTWKSALKWDITEPLVLFDSACDYAWVRESDEEHLRIELSPGRYHVQATYLEIPEEAYLVLVRLTEESQ